ncbi:hypothetical protein OPIT5_16225 [Opitutaceae bacterium TAV5]|nr:hypothetical protein OPIT5_16225 [Opitutaceae bacterium TAV5]
MNTDKFQGRKPTKHTKRHEKNTINPMVWLSCLFVCFVGHFIRAHPWNPWSKNDFKNLLPVSTP